MKNRNLGFAVRALLGLGLLAALLAHVGWERLAPLVAAPQWAFVALSLGFSALLVGVSCWKWRVFLRHGGADVALWRLFALYLIGIFFSNFLPSNFGGDAVRGIGLGRYTRAMPRAFASVFLERYTGFVALVISAWAGLLAAPELARQPLLVFALFATTGTLAASFWALADPRPLRILERVLPRGIGERVVTKLRAFVEAVHGFRDATLLLRTMALSFAFYAGAVGNVWVTARIFLATPSLSGLAVAVPLTLVVSFLPISVGSVGIAEWAYVVCLGQIGMSPEEALAVGLFLRLKQVLLSLVGAVLFIALRFEPAPERPTEIA